MTNMFCELLLPLCSPWYTNMTIMKVIPETYINRGDMLGHVTFTFDHLYLLQSAIDSSKIENIIFFMCLFCLTVLRREKKHNFVLVLIGLSYRFKQTCHLWLCWIIALNVLFSLVFMVFGSCICWINQQSLNLITSWQTLANDYTFTLSHKLNISANCLKYTQSFKKDLVNIIWL